MAGIELVSSTLTSLLPGHLGAFDDYHCENTSESLLIYIKLVWGHWLALGMID